MRRAATDLTPERVSVPTVLSRPPATGASPKSFLAGATGCRSGALPTFTRRIRLLHTSRALAPAVCWSQTGGRRFHASQLSHRASEGVE